jgi:hypothetical protein
MGFHIFRTLEVNQLLGKLLQQPNTYADFEFLAFWQTQYNNMSAVNLFFAWIKVSETPPTASSASGHLLSPPQYVLHFHCLENIGPWSGLFNVFTFSLLQLGSS